MTTVPADPQVSHRTSLAARYASAADSLLMPQLCAVCRAWVAGGGLPLCHPCADKVDRTRSASYCPRCARSIHRLSISDEDCPECRGERHWNIVGIFRLGAYDPALRKLITGLKYHGHERNAQLIAELMCAPSLLPDWIAEVDAHIPVPMHWRRRVLRPCNHARVLADALSRRLDIPVLNVARRSRHAQSQTFKKTTSERFENVADSFDMRPWSSAPPGSSPLRRAWVSAVRGGGVAGKTVCIVDNLLVAGATISEMSKVLRKAGAKRIYAAVIARAVPRGDFQALTDALTTP